MSTRILMCKPTHFDVSYVINPWMQDHVSHVDRDAAQRQWDGLHDALAERAEVVLIEPGEGLPDMPFTANAGVVLERIFVPARFRHPERQGEEALFKRWFSGHGYTVRDVPEGMDFEGAGDALLDRAQALLWMGHGHRSDAAAAQTVADLLDIETVPLRLVDERFYHLDTCLCPLTGGYLLYFPAAFDEASRAEIERRVPADRRIAAEETDAAQFACNAVNVEESVFFNAASESLQRRLREAGFAPRVTALGEFLKSGGGAKCLTLRLNEPRLQDVSA